MRHDCLMLLTDYGAEGGYVGVLHAVAHRIAPGARVIDVDHGIAPHDVRLGALRLERTMPYMPDGVHVAVVDPGVGSDRRGVAVVAGGGSHVLVGPDNGLLAWAADACGGADDVVVLDRPEFWLTPRSSTFDGRDVFMPVGAHLATGVPVRQVGTAVDPAGLVVLSRPLVHVLGDGAVELEVLQIDRFGNLQLSGDAATAATMGLAPGDPVRVVSDDPPITRPARFGRTFADVGEGELVLLVDSDGCLALSINRGSAATVLAREGGTGSTLRLVAGR